MAGRPDGLGTRLLTYMAARYFAEESNLPIVFLWPSLSDPLYSSNDIMSFSTVNEIFDNGQVFDDLSESNVRERKDASTLRYFSVHSVLAADYALDVSDILELAKTYDVIFYDTPNLAASQSLRPFVTEKYHRYWSSFNFSSEIVVQRRRVLNAIENANYAAVHLRRGDVERMLLESSEQFLRSSGLNQIFQRYLPLEQARRMLTRFVDSSMPIVVVSEDPSGAAHLARLLPNREILGSGDAFEPSSNRQAVLDLSLLATSTVLISPYTSYFSECAAKVGSTKQHRAALDIQLLSSELFPLLDASDAKDAARRKSIFLAHGWKAMLGNGSEHVNNMKLSAVLYDPEIETYLDD